MKSLAPVLLAVAVAVLGYFMVPRVDAAPSDQACMTDPGYWHAPSCGHEHGDAPPQWIADAGYQAGFDSTHGFHGNTTAQENTTKHRSMKGMLATFGQQQVYARLHFASNVFERMSRYHSYEVFIKDASNNVSHYQGWTNTGDPTGGGTGRRSKSLPDNGVRPTTQVVDQAALQMGRNCEQWYATTSSWGPDLGWTICDSTTAYFTEENQYPDYEFPLCQYGYPKPLCLGSNREMEFSLYVTGSVNAPSRGDLAPKDVHFYATQFGEGVSGQNDPRCQVGAMTNKFGKEYQNLCLEQYVASTLRAIENPSNRFRKDYDVTGVEFPN